MKYEVYVRTNIIGSDVIDEFEIDDDELAEMSEEEAEKYAEETAFDVVCNLIEWNFKRI